jgi:hypothetical protein
MEQQNFPIERDQMKTAKHPNRNRTISFDESAHRYTDDAGQEYVSGTSLAKRYFPPFDKATALKSSAAKTGRTEAELEAEWDAKGKAASEYGTRVHAYAEALILGTPKPTAETDQERRAFAVVDKALTALAKSYEILGAEMIVFDPLYAVAGTIDLPARNRKTKNLAILDWKTCESITDDNYGKFALTPIQRVRDSKLAHYMMQLSLYAWMLTDESRGLYSTAGQPAELALIHIPHFGNDPVWRPVQYDGAAAWAIIQHNYEREREKKLDRISQRILLTKTAGTGKPISNKSA